YNACNKIKQDKIYDFCYISLAHSHKNHNRLLDALYQLCEQKYSFTIALTIQKNKSELINKINKINNLGYIKIENFGYVSKDKVCDIYNKSKCLIFPSLNESFGLPLIEAATCELDILASNLNYVEQAIIPTAKFNPYNVDEIVLTIKNYINGKYQNKVIKLLDNKIDDLIKNIIEKGKK
ncbi:glycosyltransferase, partial [Aliarcobacter skirrowii]|uniref:glycosyltransferase n=1 Tax=Aliarcobacter skirrowii TaxID=28200 RepID=UPI0029BC1C03